MMRKFITKIFLFGFLCISLAGIFVGVTNILISKKAVFKFKKDSKYVVLGNSHPQCALNDSLIDSFSNYAESGESYVYTKCKAQLVLKAKSNVEIVFIEFGNGQITSRMNEWIWGDKYIDGKYSKYAPFLNLKDHSVILRNNLSGFINGASLSTKNNISGLVGRNADYSKKLGGYFYMAPRHADSILKPQSYVKEIYERSDLSIAYLMELVDYCVKNNKKVYLIRCPMHPLNLELKFEKEFREVLAKDFSGVEFLDFLNFPLSDDDFADVGHLNYKGARKFSEWFNSMIQEGMLGKQNKQEYIDSRMLAPGSTKPIAINTVLK